MVHIWPPSENQTTGTGILQITSFISYLAESSA